MSHISVGKLDAGSSPRFISPTIRRALAEGAYACMTRTAVVGRDTMARYRDVHTAEPVGFSIEQTNPYAPGDEPSHHAAWVRGWQLMYNRITKGNHHVGRS